MIIRCGSYLGSWTRKGVGIGIDADFILFKCATSPGNRSVVVKTSTMPTSYIKSLDGSLALIADAVTLVKNGFILGLNSNVNDGGVVYDYIAIEAEASDTDFEVGSYTGNASDNRNITLSTITGTPDMVWIMGDEAVGARWRSNEHSGDLAQSFDSLLAATTNRIQAFGTGNFQVGTGTGVNTTSVTYHYVAMKEVSDKFQIATYTGNGSDNRSLTGAGFLPVWAMVQSRSATGRTMMVRHPSQSGDLSSFFSSSNDVANGIQAMESDGIQVGTHNNANVSSELYTALYFYISSVNTYQVPVLESTTNTSFGSDVTTHTANYPATMNAGDLIVMLAAFDGSPTITTPTGYSIIGVVDSSDPSIGVYGRVADGSEAGSTIGVVTSNAQQGGVQIMRISNWKGALADLLSVTVTNELGAFIPAMPTTIPHTRVNYLALWCQGKSSSTAFLTINTINVTTEVGASGTSTAAARTLYLTISDIFSYSFNYAWGIGANSASTTVIHQVTVLIPVAFTGTISGNVALNDIGVSGAIVTARNQLTGDEFTDTTDGSGDYSIAVPNVLDAYDVSATYDNAGTKYNDYAEWDVVPV